MAIIWDLDDETMGTMDELVAHLDALGERVLQDDLDGSARMLRRLYNNRSFLGDLLLQQFADQATFEALNPYTPQVFMLHRGEHYFLRAAVWAPPEGRLGEEIFFYEDAHDHNFSLLTLGYLGSGYRTVLFEYEHDRVQGQVGEKVPVTFLDDTRLSAGRVLFYRPSRDIHVQYPSEDLSISFNIVVPDSMKRQFSFDLDVNAGSQEAKIKENLVFVPAVGAARAAASFGVADAAQKLKSLVEITECPHVRRIVEQAATELEA